MLEMGSLAGIDQDPLRFGRPHLLERDRIELEPRQATPDLAQADGHVLGEEFGKAPGVERGCSDPRITSYNVCYTKLLR